MRGRFGCENGTPASKQSRDHRLAGFQLNPSLGTRFRSELGCTPDQYIIRMPALGPYLCGSAAPLVLSLPAWITLAPMPHQIDVIRILEWPVFPFDEAFIL